MQNKDQKSCSCEKLCISCVHTIIKVTNEEQSHFKVYFVFFLSALFFALSGYKHPIVKANSKLEVNKCILILVVHPDSITAQVTFKFVQMLSIQNLFKGKAGKHRKKQHFAVRCSQQGLSSNIARNLVRTKYSFKNFLVSKTLRDRAPLSVHSFGHY